MPNHRNVLRKLGYTDGIIYLQQHAQCRWRQNNNEEHFSFQMIYLIYVTFCCKQLHNDLKFIENELNISHPTHVIKNQSDVCVMGIQTT